MIPAPDGRWRAVALLVADELVIRLVPPGEPLDHGVTYKTDRVARAIDRVDVLSWIDATHVAYAAKDQFHTVSVDGTRTTLPQQRVRDDARMVPDGSWYWTGYVAQVTRHVLVNFGDRPWRD